MHRDDDRDHRPCRRIGRDSLRKRVPPFLKGLAIAFGMTLLYQLILHAGN